MAHVLCSYSGIQFKCEWFSFSLSQRETAHPIFFLPQKSLAPQYQKYCDQQLSPTEEFLLFLAYLNSTELVEFRAPAKFTKDTQSIIALNFQNLVETVHALNSIQSARFVPPKIAITTGTSSLENVAHWIANWREAIASFYKGREDRELLESIQDIEVYLARTSNPQSPAQEAKHNSLLADWAAKAFAFPTFLIQDGGKPITLANYWKLLIRSCQNQEKIFQFPKEDLEELRDHLLDYIETAPKWGIDVLALVEEGMSLHNNFLGLGDSDLALNSLGGARYSIASTNESDALTKANLESIISNAPITEPIEANYPNRFAFMKAKMNWKLAQEIKINQLKAGN